jgi:hypothetical protein
VVYENFVDYHWPDLRVTPFELWAAAVDLAQTVPDGLGDDHKVLEKLQTLLNLVFELSLKVLVIDHTRLHIYLSLPMFKQYRLRTHRHPRPNILRIPLIRKPNLPWQPILMLNIMLPKLSPKSHTNSQTT